MSDLYVFDINEIESIQRSRGDLMRALVEVMIPLEVLAGQIRTKPYSEMTTDFQGKILAAVQIGRSAIAKHSGPAARA